MSKNLKSTKGDVMLNMLKSLAVQQYNGTGGVMVNMTDPEKE